jgi:hypothetical protein
LGGTLHTEATSLASVFRRCTPSWRDKLGIADADAVRLILEHRGEEAVDECVLCELRRRVKIELRHDLRFMKLDSLR